MRNLTYLAGWESNREANVDSYRLAFCSLYLLITAELLECLVCYHTHGFVSTYDLTRGLFVDFPFSAIQCGINQFAFSCIKDLNPTM
jgi:hypothetical protein